MEVSLIERGSVCSLVEKIYLNFESNLSLGFCNVLEVKWYVNGSEYECKLYLLNGVYLCDNLLLKDIENYVIDVVECKEGVIYNSKLNVFGVLLSIFVVVIVIND